MPFVPYVVEFTSTSLPARLYSKSIAISYLYNFILIYILSYNHHQMGSMKYYPLFRVRSWNNGVRCMSFCILLEYMTQKSKSLLCYIFLCLNHSSCFNIWLIFVPKVSISTVESLTPNVKQVLAFNNYDPVIWRNAYDIRHQRVYRNWQFADDIFERISF